jgi:hypothetical protein
MIYLAAPYSHPDPAVRKSRIDTFYKYDAILSKQGEFVVSPLNKAETSSRYGLPDDWEFWKNYSYELLSVCSKLVVLKIDGWATSVGVTAEIEYCVRNLIPIQYVDVE